MSGVSAKLSSCILALRQQKTGRNASLAVTRLPDDVSELPRHLRQDPVLWRPDPENRGSSNVKPAKACPIVVRDVEEQVARPGVSSSSRRVPTRERHDRCRRGRGSSRGEELKEESGVVAEAVSALGLWPSGYEGQVWSFHLCRPSIALSEAWTFRCHDDGGHDFQFFWHSLMSRTLGGLASGTCRRSGICQECAFEG